MVNDSLTVIGTPMNPSFDALPAARAAHPSDGRTRDRRRGMAAGFLAMLAYLVVVEVLRQATEVTSLLDAMADALLLFMPMSLFSLALDVFGTQAKTLLLAGLLAAMLLVGIWIGHRHAQQTAGARRPMWARAGTTGVAFFGISAVFMLWFVADRSPDVVAGKGTIEILVHLALAAAAFSVVLAASLALFRQEDPGPGMVLGADDAARLDRRRLTTRLATAGAAVAGLAVLGRAVGKVANRPTVGTNDPGEISPAITSNEDFYLISKNFSDPMDDPGDDWTLTVDGVVANELRLTKADLEAMAAPPFVSTLTCISNPIGGPLISTAQWRGARLTDVLAKAGVGPGAVDLIMTGVDDYTDSIPIERALQPEPMLVWEMNGERLPQRHGVPLRLIVPGLYGIKNVKWLKKITVANRDYEGYWQERGWTDEARIKISSRFDVPGNRDVLPAGRVEVGGVAFAGDRGISKVEVSMDGGDTWAEATIRENPSPAGLSWVVWVLEWTARPGTYDFVVRATDGTGELQTSDHADELPDGASGYHRISVGIS
jgi:DMSO/TMAO reductase YedYZ molybdopterin-dependent catalytic subunit